MTVSNHEDEKDVVKAYNRTEIYTVATVPLESGGRLSVTVWVPIEGSWIDDDDDNTKDR